MPAHHSSDIAKQHADFHRKLLLRKRLDRWTDPRAAAYVPFIGDADLAAELYADRQVFGADIDPNRTATASYRLPTAEVRVADCDSWPFPGLDTPIGLADFDAYAYPYTSYRSFWGQAVKHDRLVMLFTDGQGMNIQIKGRWRHPAGHIVEAPGFVMGKEAGEANVRRAVWAFWFSKHVWPWFVEQLDHKEWEIMDRFRYTRGIMLYWGVALQRRRPRHN